MELYEPLKVIHVLAAVLWVGGAATIQILVTRMQRAKEMARISELGRDLEMKFYAPLSVIVLLAGIGMVIVSGWNFTDLWIVFGLVGIIASALVGTIYLGPESGRIGALTEQKGPDDPEVQARMSRLFTISRIELAVLLLIVVNMVVKPGV